MACGFRAPVPRWPCAPLVFALLATAPLAAQEPARRDSLTQADTISADSFRTVLPTLGPPPGPLPHGGRIVFDEDALHFLGALTLGELLQHVPGVFLVRAGWFGQGETVAYAGQGAASLELFWDGLALDPLGEDSTGFDLGRFSLGFVRRVEVEVLPSALRVYLISDTQPVRRARTETSFATGDAQTNTYRIRYLNRWAAGTGLGLGVNWFGTNGPTTSPANVSDLALWAKGTWTPTPRVGVEVQQLRYSLQRQLLQREGAPSLPGVDVHRTDAFVRAFAATRDDGMGLRLDALFGSSSYGDSSGALERRTHQGAATVGYRSAVWSGELTTRIRDTRTPLEIRLRGAWQPVRFVTVSAYAARWTHLPDTSAGAPEQEFREAADRHSSEAGAAGELRLLRPLALHGALRWRDRVAAPAVLADTAQRSTDWSGGVAVALSRLSLDVTVARHGFFEAPAFGTFAAVLPRGTSIDVTTLTAAFSLRPVSYLSLAGWYRHPLDPIRAAFEPPHHSRIAARLESRMLTKFRRGVFDLVLQAGLEGWGDGVAGRDRTGKELVLHGATTVDYLLEIRLVGAVLFWTLRNAGVERYDLLPGYQQARSLQRFGVRWEFTN